MLPYIQIGSSQISLYSLFNTLAMPAALITNLFFLCHENELLCCWCQNIRHAPVRKKGIALRYTIYWTLFLTGLQLVIAGIFNSLWAGITNTGFGNYFGNILFTPLIMAVLLVFLRIHPLKQLDLFTPSYIVCVFFYKMGCFFHGCCNGKPWERGFYFVLRERREIPSQLLEALAGIFLLFCILHLMKKNTVPGRIMPMYLILYSSIRFFTEFTRDGDVLILGLQNYQLQCFLGIAVGILELWFLKKYGPGFNAWFDQKYSCRSRNNV